MKIIPEYTTNLGNLEHKTMNIIARIMDKKIIPIIEPAALANTAPIPLLDYCTEF